MVPMTCTDMLPGSTISGRFDHKVISHYESI